MTEVYLVFEYNDYYPSGGLRNCEGSFFGPDALERARGVAVDKAATCPKYSRVEIWRVSQMGNELVEEFPRK